MVRPVLLGEIIDEFLRRRLVTLGSIGDVMLTMGTQGRKGMRVLRSLLEARMGEGGPSHNATERRLYRILRSEGLRPVRQFRVELNRAFYIDCAFPGVFLGIEAISYTWHGTSSDWDRDKDRVRMLREAGWIVLEFTWQDIWFRPDYVIGEVRKHLDLAGFSRGGSQSRG